MNEEKATHTPSFGQVSGPNEMVLVIGRSDMYVESGGGYASYNILCATVKMSDNDACIQYTFY